MPPTKQEESKPVINDKEPPRPQVEKRPMDRGPDSRPHKFRQNFPRPMGLMNMNNNPNRGGFDKFQIPGPTTNLPSNTDQKKYSGRCRLFVGNLTLDIDEDEFRSMFTEFGEISEMFLNRQKGFGFVKMDTRQNAENAKSSLDGQMRKGRVIRVRFATHGAALKVRNLSPYVSNELLETAFSLFGEVERAVVIVDERGRPTGDGIVEFARKPGAQTALKRCNEGCFLLASSPRPVIVEPLEQKDEEDGLGEKNVPKNSQYLKEREIGPRFCPPGSFEYEFSNRWKQLFQLEKQKRETLEKEIRNDYDRLEEQMEFAVFEQETSVLREKLRQREMDANNLLRERELRRRDQEHRDHEMRRQEEMMRHGGGQHSHAGHGNPGHGNPGHGNPGHGNPEEGMVREDGGPIMRRPRGPEDNLLMQANHLNDLLAQQEAAIRQMQGSGGGGGGGAGGGGGGVGGGGSGNMANNNMGRENQGFDGQGRSGPMGNAPPRQSRFDQMPQGGPMGHVGSINRLGGPGPMGPMNEMRGGGGGGMGRREMMDQRREHRDDYPVDMKRRRF